MEKRNFWLDLFTGLTWDEFQAAGSSVTGFRDPRWKNLQKVKIGDYLICYLTGVSRFIGILEVTSAPYKDNKKNIWSDEEFPCRVKVKPIVALSPETAIPVTELRDQLSFFQNMKGPHAWTGHFRGSPTKWKISDGKAVLNALLNAQTNPIIRPVDERKLKYRPKAMQTKIGSVTVPESNEEEQNLEEQISPVKKTTEHIKIQYLLLKLGSDMGFDVWVAKNDKSRCYKGNAFSEIPRIKKDLPLQFDDATNRTIELIDVLWLKGNAIISAFEIEATTSIYSGLLRMADLIVMQPNINIPLYLVAPDERGEKVITEVNRPTFRRLNPPLSGICRFIPFSKLQEQIKQASAYIRFMKPEFLDELSETCEIEDI